MNRIGSIAALVSLSAVAAAPAAAQVRCPVPTPKVAVQPLSGADTNEGLIATSFFTTAQAKGCVAITDLTGTPSWSYCRSGGHIFMTRPVPGGTFLIISNDSFSDYAINEINLAGDTIGAITQATANSQLAALGQQQIIDFNHEAMRLPNGYTAIIAHNEQLFTNVQGGTPQNPVDVMGDEVLVVDTNWNIVWTWNSFTCPNCATKLPVSRRAPLNEQCHPCSATQNGTCCPVTLAAKANDWLHGNSLAYDSSDGNLVMSLRDQDWIIKLAYQNGAGDGHIVWTLGQDGDFAMVNTPKIGSPWFSHQHDVEIWNNVSPVQLTLFDNGNTRHASNPQAGSRGQSLTIDTAKMTADIHTNVTFGVYCSGYGTSQILDNGNYWWQAGVAGGQNGPDPTRGYEYIPSGSSGNLVYELQFADTAYRSFRLDTNSGF